MKEWNIISMLRMENIIINFSLIGNKIYLFVVTPRIVNVYVFPRICIMYKYESHYVLSFASEVI